jgi:hypothetical protein
VDALLEVTVEAQTLPGEQICSLILPGRELEGQETELSFVKVLPGTSWAPSSPCVSSKSPKLFSRCGKYFSHLLAHI